MLTACVSVRAWLCAYFQYLHTRTALLWVIMQQAVAVSYRRLTPENGTDRLSRNIGNKLPPLAA
jgi:hypothetical protein